jgi:2-polyprenyl-3-methyl-5-hydroxy-6-metoxy-1,4-benzoquinol methylase
MGASSWNHNTHYYPSILRTVSSRPRRNALDVGSGDGVLANHLAARIPSVVGIDSSAEQTKRASTTFATTPGLSFVTGDLLTAKVSGAPFDVVTCSAALHHMPMEAALERLKELTAPGGVLIIYGLATNASALDWIGSTLAIPVASISRAIRGWYEHGAPMEEPQDTYAAVKQAASRILPGSHYRKRLYWRYSIVWNRPVTN